MVSQKSCSEHCSTLDYNTCAIMCNDIAPSGKHYRSLQNIDFSLCNMENLDKATKSAICKNYGGINKNLQVNPILCPKNCIPESDFDIDNEILPTCPMIDQKIGSPQLGGPGYVVFCESMTIPDGGCNSTYTYDTRNKKRESYLCKESEYFGCEISDIKCEGPDLIEYPLYKNCPNLSQNECEDKTNYCTYIDKQCEYTQRGGLVGQDFCYTLQKDECKKMKKYGCTYDSDICFPSNSQVYCNSINNPETCKDTDFCIFDLNNKNCNYDINYKPSK